MQTIHLYPNFYRASKTVAKLSAHAWQRWHRLNLYQQLRAEGCCKANPKNLSYGLNFADSFHRT